jgi:alginate O-acetyltransferase complex protein AlgI
MVFSSLTFLFLFLPVFLAAYYLLLYAMPGGNGWAVKASQGFLLLASLVFYAWGEQLLVLVMLSSTLLDYWCGRVIAAHTPSTASALTPLARRRRRLALVVSICGNMGVLGFFKYANFFVANAQLAMTWFGIRNDALTHVPQIALPIGISFYTFQSMSYTIDLYRGRVEAARHFIPFACYVTMFPQLVAGPIVRYRQIAKQLPRPKISMLSIHSGIHRFIVGLAKKALIANTLAVPADEIFGGSPLTLTPGAAWFGVICYTLQIYFDFSGYSDMAIGLGRILGFRFPENFRYPYAARSMRDFWRRWHISLTTWMRDYLYIPLGGSRRGTGRTYCNLLIVFVLCGFWHGAEWSFLAWGLYHGVFLVAERLRMKYMHAAGIGRVYTLLAVMGGWVLFRSISLSQAGMFYGAMLGRSAVGGPVREALPLLTREVLVALGAGWLFAFPLWPWMQRHLTRLGASRWLCGWLHPAGLVAMFLLSVLRLAGGTHNPFIYFRF